MKSESEEEAKESSSSFFEGDPTKPEDAKKLRDWFDKSKKKESLQLPKLDKSSSQE